MFLGRKNLTQCLNTRKSIRYEDLSLAVILFFEIYITCNGAWLLGILNYILIFAPQNNPL
jgi:hypothetical protein